MTQSHLAHVQRFVLLFFYKKLFFELHSFHLVREVVEIDSCGILLQKIYAFYSNLIELLLFFLPLVGMLSRQIALNEKYTVFLRWLILLAQNDLVNCERSLLQLLVLFVALFAF